MDSTSRLNSTFEFDTGFYLGLINNKYIKGNTSITLSELELLEILASYYKVSILSIVLYNSEEYLDTLLDNKISVQQWDKVTGEVTDFELNVP